MPSYILEQVDREVSEQLRLRIRPEGDRLQDTHAFLWRLAHRTSSRLRCEHDYNFLMEQIEPLTQLGEEQEKKELAMQNMPTSTTGRKQGLRIRLRMWVGWVPKVSNLSDNEKLENCLEEISRDMVQSDRDFLNWRSWWRAFEREGEVVDQDFEQEEIKPAPEEQGALAAFLDDLNISSQVAWDMQMSHGVRLMDLKDNDAVRQGLYLTPTPDQNKGAFLGFNFRDLLRLPFLWITGAPGDARPSEYEPVGIEGREVINHPPFLPECIVFHGMKLYRTGRLYAGYIEYRTNDQNSKNSVKGRLLLYADRQPHPEYMVGVGAKIERTRVRAYKLLRGSGT